MEVKRNPFCWNWVFKLGLLALAVILKIVQTSGINILKPREVVLVAQSYFRRQSPFSLQSQAHIYTLVERRLQPEFLEVLESLAGRCWRERRSFSEEKMMYPQAWLPLCSVPAAPSRLASTAAVVSGLWDQLRFFLLQGEEVVAPIPVHWYISMNAHGKTKTFKETMRRPENYIQGGCGRAGFLSNCGCWLSKSLGERRRGLRTNLPKASLKKTTTFWSTQANNAMRLWTVNFTVP